MRTFYDDRMVLHTVEFTQFPDSEFAQRFAEAHTRLMHRRVIHPDLVAKNNAVLTPPDVYEVAE
jgi:hypothetical protein